MTPPPSSASIRPRPARPTASPRLLSVIRSRRANRASHLVLKMRTPYPMLWTMVPGAVECQEAALDRLFAIAPALEAAGAPPITEDEIQAEVDAVRGERRAAVPIVLDTNVVVSALLARHAAPLARSDPPARRHRAVHQRRIARRIGPGLGPAFCRQAAGADRRRRPCAADRLHAGRRSGDAARGSVCYRRRSRSRRFR